MVSCVNSNNSPSVHLPVCSEVMPWIPKNADRRGWPGWAEGKWCPGDGEREEVGPGEEPNSTGSPAGDRRALVSAPAGSDGVASVHLARHLLREAVG